MWIHVGRCGRPLWSFKPNKQLRCVVSLKVGFCGGSFSMNRSVRLFPPHYTKHPSGCTRFWMSVQTSIFHDYIVIRVFFLHDMSIRKSYFLQVSCFTWQNNTYYDPGEGKNECLVCEWSQGQTKGTIQPSIAPNTTGPSYYYIYLTITYSCLISRHIIQPHFLIFNCSINSQLRVWTPKESSRLRDGHMNYMW